MTNVFEWCWEHSRAEGDTRRILLWLAFRDEHYGTQPKLPSITAIGSALNVPWHAVSRHLTELVNLGELSLNPDDQAITYDTYELSAYYEFSAYQAWLTEHEVAW
ncbi:MAG: hypothetical protein ACRDTZ_01015 [Pseudonocardiaceae bacterium]